MVSVCDAIQRYEKASERKKCLKLHAVARGSRIFFLYKIRRAAVCIYAVYSSADINLTIRPLYTKEAVANAIKWRDRNDVRRVLCTSTQSAHSALALSRRRRCAVER